MAEGQQNKRPLKLRSEICSSSSKKSKAPPASPSCPVSGAVSVTVKQEPVEGDIAHGGRASRATPAVAEQANPPAEVEVEPPRVNGSVELQLLHCAVAAGCFRPLKPPVFKCEAGHRLCGSCRGGGGGGEGYCRRCRRDTAFVHCGPDLDEYVSGFKVPCPFEAYGCDSAVVYHEVAAHRAACAYALCNCAVAGCAFTASPPMLRDHLAAEHSLPVYAFPCYGMPIPLIVPTAASGWHHRLLVVEGDNRRLFVLSARARGNTASWAVTVECVRTSGAAEAGPQYVCILSAEAPPAPRLPASESRRVMLETEVASCAAPGGPAVDGGMEMVVPPLMLVGPSREIRLRVRCPHQRGRSSSSSAASGA